MEKSDKKEKSGAGDGMAKDIGILVVITLAAGILLGAAYSITRDPIAQAQARATEAAQRIVMPEAASFTAMGDGTAAGSEGNGDAAENSDKTESAGSAFLAEVNRALGEKGLTGTTVEQMDLALDAAGEKLGYVVTCTNAEGYGGDVELMCGITASEDGTLTINGISFLTLTETAGMGMRAKEGGFTDQFAGKEIPAGELLAYNKNGASAENEIDAISGCTITTGAVTKDVSAALEAVRAAEWSGL